eukprot:5802277-Pleurochrysis_carterae.AAC.1
MCLLKVIQALAITRTASGPVFTACSSVLHTRFHRLPLSTTYPISPPAPQYYIPVFTACPSVIHTRFHRLPLSTTYPFSALLTTAPTPHRLTHRRAQDASTCSQENMSKHVDMSNHGRDASTALNSLPDERSEGACQGVRTHLAVGAQRIRDVEAVQSRLS